MKKEKILNVRFEQIQINNCKNVLHGEVDFIKTSDSDYSFQPSILGLYGQNGSGKTTLIQVIEIFKTLWMGLPIPAGVWDIISIDSDYCELTAKMVITDNTNEKYSVTYYVKLKKELIPVDNTNGNSLMHGSAKRVVVIDEVLSASYRSLDESKKMVSMGPIINYCYDREDVFSPNTKLNSLTGNSSIVKNRLLAIKQISHDTLKSFIFSIETLNEIRNNSNDTFSKSVIENIVHFANTNLFVIGTKNTGLIDLNIGLPVNFKTINNGNTTYGNIMINLVGTSPIPKEAYESVKAAFDSINKVLCQIIPNLTIVLEKVGEQNDSNGMPLVQVQLYSLRNERKISMVNESEGVKKIVSILQLLIVMYNNPSTTVAIDELDSGIFEYLLGELLRIISKHAKGQLVFTSHNLRALETIDKKYVYFSTTNPNNRYVRMLHVSKNNNLRDFYFHELLLCGQKEELYERTQNGAIALAFYEAGDIFGS